MKHILNANDYIWIRVLPQDPYEHGIDAIWCNKDNASSHPVIMDLSVEYSKPSFTVYPNPSSLGKIIGTVEKSGEVEFFETYFAAKYVKPNVPSIS